MRISLIGPKWNKLVNSYPSLGLGYVAALLEQDGHQVRIHDFGLTPHSDIQDDLREVTDFAPELVGMTSMTGSYHYCQELGALIKDTLGVPIVLGGPHATVFPRKVLQEDSMFDFVVFGEGEVTFQVFVRKLLRGENDWENVPGLVFRRDGAVIQNPERALIPDLDALPFPSRHLFQLDRYPLFAPNGKRMVTLLSSRGCPYNCSFCFKGIVGRTYRQRSPANLIAEIKLVKEKYGYEDFYFIDDLFTIDVKRLDTFCEAMIAADLGVRWQCLARVDRVTAPILKKMYRAGCREVHYGIESGNEAVLARTAKHISLQQVRQAVAWSDEAGIRAKGYFMLGLPGDTIATMEETIHFAASLPLDEAMFSITTPFPGTRLWDELVKKNPETVYNQDFTKAYYYNNYTAEIAPFMNVSEVEDGILAGMAIRARQTFQVARRRRQILKTFGPTWGRIALMVMDNRLLKALGRGLWRSPLLAGLRRRLVTGVS